MKIHCDLDHCNQDDLVVAWQVDWELVVALSHHRASCVVALEQLLMAAEL